MRFTFIAILLSCAGAARGALVSTLEDVPLNVRSDYYNGTNAAPNASGQPVSPNFASAGFTYHGISASYGDGFVASNRTDTANHQPAAYQYQYDAIAGGGADNSAKYAVAFDSTSVRVDLPAGQRPQSARFTNTPYAYYTMLNGDAPFSKQFVAGDWFKVTIAGLDSGGAPTGSPVDFYLADLRSADAGSRYILTTWGTADLTPLGNASSLLFTLASSDTGAFGMNTPAYFAMDNLTSVPEPSAAFAMLAAAFFAIRRRRCAS